ncbi:MAG: AI-2E family transporter [Candidatus Woesearchaeota archaeon]
MAKRSARYFFLPVLAVFLLLSAVVLLPFATPILSGVILSVLVYPLYRFVNFRIKNPDVSALLVTVVIVLLICIPMLLVAQQIGYQAKVIYVLTRKRIVGAELFNCAGKTDLLCRAGNYWTSLNSNPEFVFQRDKLFKYVEDYIWNKTPNLLFAIPGFILNIFVMVLVLFVGLKHGRAFARRLTMLMPVKQGHKRRILKRLKDVFGAIVNGQVVVGLVQGFVGLLGLYAFGIASPLVLGLVMTFAAFIPFLGAAFVWVPIALLEIFDAMARNDPNGITQGVGFFFYGFFVISMIDNVIKPKIMADKAKVSPIIVFIGLLGGIAVFGFVGIVLGPLILSLTLTLIQIYEEERDEITS